MIHPLQQTEFQDAVSLVADSFTDDPSVDAILPGQSRDQAVHILGVYVKYLLMEGMRRGCVSVMKRKNKLAGVVIYFPPHTLKTTRGSWFQSISAAITLLTLLGIGGFRRLMRLTKAIESQRPSKPHYYIELGCVARELKHTGVGKVLAKHIFRLANRDHCGVYAETFNPKNIEIMQRLGYEIQSKHDVNGLSFWSLWHQEMNP